MKSFFSKLFVDKDLKQSQKIIALINEKESHFQKLSSEELNSTSKKLEKQVRDGESLDDILPEAFALVRETSRRTLDQQHYDVQLVGGLVLHEGKITEMLTGEGKTLAATLPVYLNALSKKGVHVVTVNEYLARRDTVWMGQIYHALGLSIACLVHEGAYQYDPEYIVQDLEVLDKERDEKGGFKVVDKFMRPISRKEAYNADITYGTNHEFGFDYLRDNLAARLEDRVQRGHHYVIIDEVDSILIDEARTPLIISAPDQQSSEYYKLFARVMNSLERESDYEVDEKRRTVSITDEGIEKVEKTTNVTNLFAPENARLVHYMNESLKAKALFQKDKDYVVKDKEVIIVDQFTGRMLHGRRYSEGLHQAIEAKENVPVQQENRTYAQITIQNYFRFYEKVAGMTGTAQTSAEEFHKVYELEVISVPPNKPVIREDMPDVIYKTKEAKYKAVVQDVKRRHEQGQPVLLGTASIEHNEIISSYLQRAGVPYEILNAKNNEREGEIIAQAGRSGAVTVATNMAGRGVDIVLGGNPPDQENAERVKQAGGLHVIGTERHEARRIDNQLRGRSGRQGDAGSSQFFLSLEDDLLRIFGGERISNIMETFNVPEDMPIESGLVSKAVNQAQQKVEGMNLDIRRHLLDFDDVLNRQRNYIYKRRILFLESGKKNKLQPIIKKAVSNYADYAIQAFEGEIKELREKREDEKEVKKREEVIKKLKESAAKIPESIEPERSEVIGQHITKILDALWVDHLDNLQSLRESVNIRAYAQHEPLVEYRKEAHILFQQLDQRFDELIFKTIFPIFEVDIEKIKAHAKAVEKSHTVQHIHGADGKKVGRNDPCPCGAKKSDGRPMKYKHCHGKGV